MRQGIVAVIAWAGDVRVVFRRSRFCCFCGLSMRSKRGTYIHKMLPKCRSFLIGQVFFKGFFPRGCPEYCLLPGGVGVRRWSFRVDAGHCCALIAAVSPPRAVFAASRHS